MQIMHFFGAIWDILFIEFGANLALKLKKLC